MLAHRLRWSTGFPIAVIVAGDMWNISVIMTPDLIFLSIIFFGKIKFVQFFQPFFKYYLEKIYSLNYIKQKNIN